jgi:acyl-coenzyme A thioesterase PaaI-like protein
LSSDALTHVFDRAIAIDRTGDEADRVRFTAHLTREMWVSDSGPWGGYIAALFTQAMGRAVDDLPLLSLTVNVLRRLDEGDADVVVDVESRGARLAHVSARIVQGGRPGAIGIATLGRNPQPDFVTDFIRPDAPSPGDLTRRAESRHPYMQHFDVRPTTVIRPWSGTNEGTLAGWINLVEPRPLDLPLLAALPDAWMPGSWARLTEPAGKITVNMTTHFRAEIGEDDVGWWFVRVRTRHVERGFADEECEIWGGDGRFLAQSRQLVLLGRR